MKNFFRSFTKGFFVLLPFLIAYLMLGQLFDMMMALAQPVLDVLPASPFPGEWTQKFTAAGILVVIIALVGLSTHTAIARRFGNWFETTFLRRFPPYNVLRSLATWISGKDTPDQLQPALLSVTPDSRMLVAIIEELPSGELTVFVPLAPAPGLGVLQIVKPEKVQKLESSMTDALGWVMNWGAGTEALFKARKSSRDST